MRDTRRSTSGGGAPWVGSLWPFPGVRLGSGRARRTLALGLAALAVGLGALFTPGSAHAAQYDAILEWNGPYLRAIRSPQDQATDDPVVEIPFLAPYSVAAREHDDRDVVYVLDAGNRRIQAFEVNATFEYVVDDDLFYRSSGSSESAEWSGDEIRLPGWDTIPDRWILPRSEEAIINGSVWTWVSDLTGYTAEDEVYTIDYDTGTFGPRLLFPTASLNETSSIRLTYLVSDNQTGAAPSYGIGDVDYGIGEGASPVLTEIDEGSGGPTSFQSLRALALITNETDSTSDDLFVLDYADDSAGGDESLFYYTIASDGTVTFRESFGDSLVGPFDVAVARSGNSVPPTVTLSSDNGLFDQGTAAIVDPNQVTGHSYAVTNNGLNVTIEDATTGRVLVSQVQDIWIEDPYYGIPGLELRTQISTESVVITTTRARPARYLFVAETDQDRITVLSAADGASFPGDWLPLDVHQVITQPVNNIGELPDVDYSESTPASVPAGWSHWTAAQPVAHGSLDSVTFENDGTWTRVDTLANAGPTDKVFQLDRSTGRIRFGDGTNGAVPPGSEEFTYTYAVTPTVLRFGTSGTGDGEFDGPKGIAAHWNASLGGFDVYVADTGNDRIQKLRFFQEDVALGLQPRIEYVTEWNSASGPSDGLSAPTGIVVREDGGSPAIVRVAVADSGNDRIVLYDDVAARTVGGGSDPATFELALGASVGTLGGFQLPVGVELLPNGTDHDVYAVDASRGIVVKYERAPDPAVNVDWLPADCYATRGSYPLSFTTVNPPSGGWIDFYFDDSATFDEGSARLALPSGSVDADATSAVWVFEDSPGGAPGGGTFYLFARLFDSEGELLATSTTASDETVCIDPAIVPTIAIRDAFDGDSTVSFQAGAEGILRLVVAHPDSVVAVGFEGSFDPTVLEIVSISSGSAWEGTGATSVLFESNIDNTGATFEVNATALDTPFGLTGEGPHTIANVRVRARPSVLDLETRYMDSTIHLEVSGTSMTNLDSGVSPDLTIQDLAVRVAYLGDLATTGQGADGEVGALAPNPDGFINFADIMAFTLGWNGAGFTRDRIADIGPATGVPPNLHSVPDGNWDIDDIVVLTQMYSWAGASGFSGSGGSPRPGDERRVSARHATATATATASGESNEADGLRIEVGPTHWTAGEEVLLEVYAGEPFGPEPGLDAGSGTGLAVGRMGRLSGDPAIVAGRPLGANLVLEFEPGILELVGADPGGFLDGSEGRIFLDRSGPGWIEVTGTRLGRATTEESTAPFARLRLRLLRDGLPSLRVRHEIQDESGKVVTAGSWVWNDAPNSNSTLRLHPFRPNPTPGPASVVFDLPASSPVRLCILDAGGRMVRVLADEAMEAGTHVLAFDGRVTAGQPLAPGVYFARLEAVSSVVHRKLVVVH